MRPSALRLNALPGRLVEVLESRASSRQDGEYLPGPPPGLTWSAREPVRYFRSTARPAFEQPDGSWIVLPLPNVWGVTESITITCLHACHPGREGSEEASLKALGYTVGQPAQANSPISAPSPDADQDADQDAHQYGATAMHDHPPGCGCGHHPAALPDPHALRADGQVSLSGQLVCRNAAEMMAVLEHAASHIEESRAETGCLQFDLVQTDDPLVFAVAERFADEAAYRAHQTRTRASSWYQATRDIAREGYDRRGVTE